MINKFPNHFFDRWKFCQISHQSSQNFCYILLYCQIENIFFNFNCIKHHVDRNPKIWSNLLHCHSFWQLGSALLYILQQTQIGNISIINLIASPFLEMECFLPDVRRYGQILMGRAKYN
jgi:hypothetical protein